MPDPTYPPPVIAAAAKAAHKALDEGDDGWHYACAHPQPDEPKECWKGDRAAEMLAEDVIPAVLDALVANGWRYEPDILRAAADDLTALYVQAMRDGREHDGIDPYATAADAVVWLRSRADGQVIFDV